MESKIIILMSTYNGEKYLREQIESILALNTENMKIDILVRDDGSEDRTKAILQNYAEKNKQIKWYSGENKGPAKSFIELLNKAKGYDFYAFCDQDDVWKKDKIKVAIDKMQYTIEKPTLYFSAVDIVDQNLNKIMKKKWDINFSIENSFIINPAMGCTMILNDKLKKIICEKDLDFNIEMHDSWIYRVGQSINANIIYDDNSYILYRQHGNNVMGYNVNVSLRKKLSYFLKKRPKYLGKIAEMILFYYENLIDDENKKVLSDIINLSQKHTLKNMKIILSNKNFSTNNKRLDIKFKYDVIFNRI